MARTTRSMARKVHEEAETALKMTATAVMMAGKEEPISLLPCPPEIRARIYQYHFSKSKITISRVDLRDADTPGRLYTNIAFALTLTNKATRLESLPFLYKSTELRFRDTGIPYTFEEIQAMVPMNFITGIKYISCSIGYSRFMPMSPDDFPSLTRLDVEDHHTTRDLQDDPVEALKTRAEEIFVTRAFELLTTPNYAQAAHMMRLWDEARSYQLIMVLSVCLEYRQYGFGLSSTLGVDLDKRTLVAETDHREEDLIREAHWKREREERQRDYEVNYDLEDSEDDSDEEEQSDEEYNDYPGWGLNDLVLVNETF